MKIRTYLPLHYAQTRPSGAALLRYYQLRDSDCPDIYRLGEHVALDRFNKKFRTVDAVPLLRNVCHFLLS